MNTHRTIGFAAAVLVTVAQIAVFATDTAAVAQNGPARAGYEYTLDARVSPQAAAAPGERVGPVAG
jgi:hypothetical protein